MKSFFRVIGINLWLTAIVVTHAATLYVDLNSSAPTPPYGSWSTAATNIQDAIDVATSGDVVVVTNGVYATGGKVMFGDLTNRIALDKAITVQSVNGPWFTTITGNGATNGTAAVRCAWLTNGAELNGFTLTAGATRTSGDQTNLLSGGGVLCLSNALLRNCLVVSNVSQTFGGGVSQGTAINTAIIGNRSSANGSGAAYASLLNCTVVSNWLFAATFQCRHTNTIVYHNITAPNYSGGTFAFSCTTPAPGGVGNITGAPLLFPDSLHLTSTSPCRGAGTNLATGLDIDGQTWSNPPSIGCDEWRETPIIVKQPRLELTNNPIGFKVSVIATGQEPLIYYWTRNGTPIEDDGHFSLAHNTNVMATGITEQDAGIYQVAVSNSFGVVTSAVTELVFRYVNAANPVPAFPYTSWASAATNIQDAIDAAVSGEVVLVTNGIYRSGGKMMGVNLTNRVALNKAIIVQSVNGYDTTIIEGNWNPIVANGSNAIRCAWLTNGAALSGFTLRGGATRSNSVSVTMDMYGGGVWGSSTNAVVADCLIATNTAFSSGGGAYRVSLINCSLIGNRAVGNANPGSGSYGSGGGAATCNLRNCILRGNYADSQSGGGTYFCALTNCALIENSTYMEGGAAYGGSLLNCTVTRNISSGYGLYGAAVNSAALTNCLVWGNISRTSGVATNYANSTLTHSLSSPLAPGVGNLEVEPQILPDGIHIAEGSPCRGAGMNLTALTDIDGQPWATPPVIGCDEWLPAPVITFAPGIQVSAPSRNLTLSTVAAGQLPLGFSWFKDGTLIQPDEHYTDVATANLKILKFGPEHAGNYSVIASNGFGMTTSKVVSVVIRCADPSNLSPTAPYLSWATAASTLQDVVDMANAGDIILATNGVYSVGGRVMAGDLTNRVALNKPVTLMSMNGYRSATIEGAWDSVSTNGNAAIRAVWLADGATIGGFTIRNGATRSSGNSLTLQSGGGAWGNSTNATVVNCLLTNNSAYSLGGGAYSVTLKNCILTGNSAISTSGGGGGAANSSLFNCTVINNLCFGSGGPYRGGGTRDSFIRNSIVAYNLRRNLISFPTDNSDDHYETPPLSGGIWYSCCPTSITGGQGNILTTPVFLDLAGHIPAVSPCRGTASLAYSSGEDIDGEQWANPPSMGADEVIDVNLTGPITVTLTVTPHTNTFASPQLHLLYFTASLTGRVSRIDWDFGDGVTVTNAGYTISRGWTNTGSYTVTATAYNNDYPSGVSASIAIHVFPLPSPTLQLGTLDASGFKFSFPVQAYGLYTVQYATNLTPPITWKTLQTIFPNFDGPTYVTDPAWTNDARFYRVWVR